VGREPTPQPVGADCERDVTMSGAAPSCCEAEDVGESLVARLDPRTRLLAGLAFVVGVISLETLPPLLLAVATALVLVALARLPFVAMRHRLLHVEGFMLVLLVLLPVTTPGVPLLSIGPLSMTEEGVLHASTIALKVNAAVLAVFALLGSLEPVRLGRAAARLGLPLKLAHLFLFVVRYVGVFRAEIHRLLEAMRARAFVPRSNLHTWRTFGNLAGMMLVRSLDRAERVDEAMRCRGFSGRFPLATAESFTRRDVGFGAVIGLAIVALVAADKII
jgi:cobalt/nickel transport system permease protein